jgi:hypothetical protein
MRRRSRASSKLAKARSRKVKTLKAVRHSSSSASGQRTEWLTRELHEAQDHPFSNFALHASSEPFEARRRADKLPCAAHQALPQVYGTSRKENRIFAYRSFVPSLYGIPGVEHQQPAVEPW